MSTKDFIIVSIYDMGYNFSTCIDGEFESGYDTPKNYTIFHKFEELDMPHFLAWLQETYPNKAIIVCDDGDIYIA